MTLKELITELYESVGLPVVQAEAPADDNDEEEEEEEDDEPHDVKEQLEEDCAKTAECAPHKHHYDECVARVTAAEEEEDDDKKGKKEDCVEEYFHLMHCASQCAAPKLFSQLK